MNVNHGVSGQEVDGRGGPGHKTGAMQAADWRGPGSTGVLVPTRCMSTGQPATILNLKGHTKTRDWFSPWNPPVAHCSEGIMQCQPAGTRAD